MYSEISLDLGTKRNLVRGLWEACLEVKETKLHLHRYLPNAPLFPLRRNTDEAMAKPLGDPMDVWLEDLAHLACTEMPKYRLLLVNSLGTFDGFSREHGVNQGDDGFNLMFIDAFLTHPITILRSMLEYEVDLDERVCFYGLIDCELYPKGDSNEAVFAMMRRSCMKLSEFLAFSVEGGFITQRQFSDIRYQLLDLDAYIRDYGGRAFGSV